MRVISLFSGAGGLDLGLVRAGHTIVWANDIDEDAARTYRTNLEDVIELEDICRIDVSGLPAADVVVGGFPCQGFSQANMKRWEGDERNGLFAQFSRVLRAKQPKYFVAENVRGLLSLGGGAVLSRILTSFKRSGYRVNYAVLNAADYGVPQNRHRVVFLGTRSDLPESRTLVHPEPTHANPRLAEKLKRTPWVGIGEALAHLPNVDEPHQLPNHVCSQYKLAFRNFTGHRKTDPLRPSPTILARGNGRGGVCAIPHPTHPRRMSVRESALAQTFPLDFEFVGALNSMYRQVGNAVPVLLASRLADAFDDGQQNDARMKVISLFSGAGGMDLGFRAAGHDVVWANDVWEDAVLTYRKNLGDHVELAPIEALSPAPDADIVIGGFPCQGFSIANRTRSTSDGRNRLYLELLRVIREKRPKYFVAENVKGILSLGGGAVFKVILEDFRALGYEVTHSVLNAADFGVPQRRERVFIVGWLPDSASIPAFPPSPTHAPRGSARAAGLEPWVGVGEALANLPDPDSRHGVPNHASYSAYKLRFNGHLGHREVKADLPAPTITARGDDRGGVVVIHHPNNLRRVTPREAATIQSFPRDFEFVGTRTSAYRQIANAVPPLLAQRVAECFIRDTSLMTNHQSSKRCPASRAKPSSSTSAATVEGDAQLQVF